MGENEVKKALAFLSNPRGDFQTVASWSQAQKIEFLRGKLSPGDLEEVLKKSQVKAGDDLTQFFEMEPTTAPQPAAVQVPKPELPDPSQKKSGYGIYGLLGAGLLGALTSALFFVHLTIEQCK